jgi:photosynthetic reaction center cytochrome c subunit
MPNKLGFLASGVTLVLMALVTDCASQQASDKKHGPAQQSAPAASAPAPSQSPADVPLLAEDVFQNVQVFKGKPAAQMIPAMDLWRHQLGVDCSWCHVLYAWDKDDIKAKKTARMMYAMTDFINSSTFDGKDRVNCWTCHRAQPVPVKPAKSADESRMLAIAQEVMAVTPEQADQPAEAVFKNIQALKGVPAGKLPAIMTYFATSLGVKCGYCHINPFRDDSKPQKQMARKMLSMVGGISKNFYNSGKIDIGCQTCHLGQPKPPEGMTVAGVSPAPPNEGAPK